MKLHTSILLGLVAGAAVGGAARLAGAPLQRAVLLAEPLGTAFIRLVTMVVVPLVIASLFVGVASLGDVRRLGQIGGRSLGWFLATTVAAATIGLATALVLHVGRNAPAVAFASQAANGADAPDGVSAAGLGKALLALIPQNPFAAAAQADLLPLIVAVCLFAAAATAIGEERRRPLLSFFESVNDVAMVLIRWLMALAPAAVLVLIAATVARSGLAMLRSLLWYAVVVVIALGIHVGAVLLPLLRARAGLGVGGFLRAVGDALLLALSTASSSATLPVSMAAARDRLGIPNEVASFLLPAGTTLNKNGAAVYKAVTAVFLAQVYGLHLDPVRLGVILITASVAAFAGAGVPGSSLVTTLIVLNAIGLGPRAAAGIALVTGIDRPLDMCRTTVNTLGNLVGAAVVARRHQGTPESGRR